MQKTATLASATNGLQRLKWKVTSRWNRLKKPAKIALVAIGILGVSFLAHKKGYLGQAATPVFGSPQVCIKGALHEKTPKGLKRLKDKRTGGRIPC